jgi:glycosyltransferase involved in cell wall biosynthesis
VANEALACGCPVVLSDAVGSAPDLAGDGTAGRVFPMGNVGALADAIAQLLDSPPSPGAIAAKSAAFSVERAAEGIVCAADFAADRRKRPNVSR